MGTNDVKSSNIEILCFEQYSGRPTLGVQWEELDIATKAGRVEYTQQYSIYSKFSVEYLRLYPIYPQFEQNIEVILTRYSTLHTRYSTLEYC